MYQNSRRNNHYSKDVNQSSLTQEKVKFYIDGKVDRNLYNIKAENIASILAEASKDTNSYTQLRRFYDEVVDFYDEIESSKDKNSAFEIREPLILMLNSKVSYALGRKKVDENFVNFIKYSLNQVKNYDDFKVFKLLFEAVMGFLRAKKAK